MNIIELRAENFKRLKAVRVHPRGTPGLVVVAGRNAQGKSSVLDAISSTIGGKDELPSAAVRHGTKRAEVVLDLGEIKVKRVTTDKGSRLEVTRDGVTTGSPQAVLDALAAKVTFDPLSFATSTPAARLAMLGGAAGVDIDAHRAALSALVTERRDANRDAGNAEKAVTQVREQLGADAISDATDVPAELAKAKAALDVGRAAEREAQQRRHAAVLADRERLDAVTRVNEVRAIIQGLEVQLEKVGRRLVECEATVMRLSADAVAAAKAVLDTAIPDIAALQARVDTLQAQAARAQATETLRIQLRNLEQQHARASDAAQKADAEIKALCDAHATAIRAATEKLGISGLALGDQDVTLAGIPFAECASSERLRVSVAIGMAMNPTLRVLLIRDGACLDADGMETLASMAVERGYQIWVERVGHDELATVVIEDGEATEVTEPVAIQP